MLINGKSMDLPAGVTVTDLFQILGFDQKRVVVEVNLQVITPEQYPVTAIKRGDQVEIVGFVGGG